jgi:hypothetical protein
MQTQTVDKWYVAADTSVAFIHVDDTTYKSDTKFKDKLREGQQSLYLVLGMMSFSTLETII